MRERMTVEPRELTNTLTGRAQPLKWRTGILLLGLWCLSVPDLKAETPFERYAPLNLKVEKAQGNLPPEGTWSLFDYLFSKRDGDRWVYDVPTTYEGIRQRLEQLGIDVNEVLIPLGRSVQRLETDLGQPRIVATPEGNPRQVERNGVVLPNVFGRLFFGFGERMDQLEVISYNPLAGRFEFQVVEHLSKPERQSVKYENREFCQGCHIHAVPIFSRNPWLETNAKLPSDFNPEDGSQFDMGDRMEAERREKNLTPTSSYHGIDIRATTNQSAYNFDARTDLAAEIIQAQMSYRFGCGGDDDADIAGPVDCRAALLKLVVRMVEQDRARIVDRTSEHYRALAQLWQRFAGQAFGALIFYPITELRVRDPFRDGEGLVRRQDAQGRSFDGERDDDLLRLLMQETAIPGAFDPLTIDKTSDNPYIHHPEFAGDSQTSTYGYPRYFAALDLPRVRKVQDDGALHDFITQFAVSLSTYFDQLVTLIPFNSTTNQSDFSRIDALIDSMAAEAKSGNRGSILANRAFVVTEFVKAVLTAAGEPREFLIDGSRRPRIGAGTDVIDPDEPEPGDELTAAEKVAFRGLQEHCGRCHSRDRNTGATRLALLPTIESDGFSYLDQSPGHLKVRRILTRIDPDSACVPEPGRQLMPPGGAAAAFHRDRVEGTDQSLREHIVRVLRQRYFADDDNPCDHDKIAELARGQVDE